MIYKFIFLAIANIDVKLSKPNYGPVNFPGMINSGNVNLTIQKLLIDAWVFKMQQKLFKNLRFHFRMIQPFRTYRKCILNSLLRELKSKIK